MLKLYVTASCHACGRFFDVFNPELWKVLDYSACPYCGRHHTQTEIQSAAHFGPALLATTAGTEGEPAGEIERT